MTEETKDICALCKHFRMKEYPEYAAKGEGRCHGYDDAVVPLKNPFTPWDTRACVLFDLDRPARVVRTAWIEKQRAKQQG